MIKIMSILPQHYAIWHCNAIYLHSVLDFRITGDFAVILRSQSVEEDPIDEGWIYDEPSENLSDAYNDCFQYEVDARLTREIAWYDVESKEENTVYGGTKYTIRVRGESSSKVVTAAVSETSSFDSDSTFSGSYYESEWAYRGWVEERLGGFKFSYFHRDYQGDDTLWLRIVYNYSAVHTPDPGHEQMPPISRVDTIEVPMLDTNVTHWTDYTDLHLTKSAYIPTHHLAWPQGRPAELIKPWDTPSYGALVWFCDEICAFGDLSARAAESIKALDINSIAYLKDFAELGKLAKSLTALANPEGKGLKTAAKAASSTYLAAHYGAELTVKDTFEIADAIDELAPELERTPSQRLGAEKHFTFEDSNGWLYSVDLRLSGYIDSFSKEVLTVSDSMKRCKRALYESDLVPSMENIWDMVPFSFVMDWFVPIGEGAERLETIGHIQTLPVQALFYSRKIHWARPVEYFTPSGDRITGSAVCDLYYRQCTDSFYIPPLRVDSPQGLSGHWIESTALLVQFIK